MTWLRRLVNVFRISPIHKVTAYLRDQEIAANSAADVIERQGGGNWSRMNAMERELLRGKTR